MKKILSTFFSLLCLGSAYAADITVDVAIAVDADTKPTTTFAPDTPKLNAFFRTTGTEKDQSLRGVLIAEDVGAVAPANTQVLETAVTGDKKDFVGAFTFSKPTKGWPVGKYRVAIYSGDKLVASTKFSVVTAK